MWIIIDNIIGFLFLAIFYIVWYNVNIDIYDHLSSIIILLWSIPIVLTIIIEFMDFIRNKNIEKPSIKELVVPLINYTILSLLFIIPYKYGYIKKENDFLNIIVLKFILWIIIEEACSYTIHRLMHHKSIYKYVHKMHHKYKYTRPLHAQYLSIYELFIHIIPSSFLPLFIVGPISLDFYILMTIFLLSFNIHSHRKVKDDNDRHGIHHLKFNKNFGNLSLLDIMFNTESINKP